MFTIEHQDGTKLSADSQGWKVVDMSKDSIDIDVVSEIPDMRPGRMVYGVSYGIREYSLSFTVIYATNLVYEQTVDLVNSHFLRDSPYYLYRDFRAKNQRTTLPTKRALVVGKSVKVQRLGQNKAQFEVVCESYELPFVEDTTVQKVTWNGPTTVTLNNAGGHRIDPRYCLAKLTITAKAAGSQLKISVNNKPYFWYKRAVANGDKFIVDGVDVTKNGYNCFEDCHKQTTFFKVGSNSVKIEGASCTVVFEYRRLYL